MKSFYDTVENKDVSVEDVLKCLTEFPKTSNQIAGELGINDGITNVYLRKLITTAIQEGHLIGSSPSGYWKITTYEEFNEAIQNLQNRILGIESRIYSLKRNWEEKCYKDHTNQLELF